MACEDFLSYHGAQLAAVGLPEQKWPVLFEKLSSETFDAGACFSFEMSEDEADTDAAGHADWRVVVKAEQGIKADDSVTVWLVDHAWSFTWSRARRHLEQNPALRTRMKGLLRGEGGEEDVLREIWRHANTYRLNIQGFSDESLWYVMDEFGSRIRHSLDGSPSVAVAPFYFAPAQVAFSLVWPLRDMQCGDEVTRDYLANERDPYLRAGKLLAFYPDMELPTEGPAATPSYQLEKDGTGPPATPGTEWVAPSDEPISVFTDLNVVKQSLSDPRFEIVENEGALDSAHVNWATQRVKHYDAYMERHPQQLLMQFPNERQLVCKDLLIATCTREPPPGVPSASRWLPTSFNSETQLHDFIREYRRRKAASEDTVFIVKPWNKARSVDVVVSDELGHILRLLETGPKVICKYLSNTATIRGCKFDLRFYILLRRGAPKPEVYVHKVFSGRVANKPYSLDSFDDFEKHGTVFWYRGIAVNTVLYSAEFMEAFDSEYGTGMFERVRGVVHTMIADVVRAACLPDDRDTSVGFFEQGRAIYGVDVMLERCTEGPIDQDCVCPFRPYLLEVTYMPDMRKALTEHPSFVNDVLSTLVLDDPPENDVITILGA